MGKFKIKLDAVHLYLDAKFFEITLKYTNEEIQCRRNSRGNSELLYYNDFDMVEMKAAIGLCIILSGVLSCKGECLRQMWSERYGRPIFRSTMSKNRFALFLACKIVKIAV